MMAQLIPARLRRTFLNGGTRLIPAPGPADRTSILIICEGGPDIVTLWTPWTCPEYRSTMWVGVRAFCPLTIGAKIPFQPWDRRPCRKNLHHDQCVRASGCLQTVALSC